MIRLNFPQSKVYLEYNAQWFCGTADGLQLPITTVSPELRVSDLINALLTVTTFWRIADSKSQCKPVPAPPWESALWPAEVAFDSSKPTRYPMFYMGSPITYDDVTIKVTGEQVQELILSMVCATIKECKLYSDFYAPKIPDGLAIRAVRTGQAFKHENGAWTPTMDINSGWEVHTTRFGYSVHTQGAPQLDLLIPGIDVLSMEVAKMFPPEMLRSIPEGVFTMPADLSPYEKHMHFATNHRRLLYVLNTDAVEEYKAAQQAGAQAVQVTDASKEKEQVGVELASAAGASHAPTRTEVSILVLPEGGAPISCGGSISVEGADGVYTMEALAKLLQRGYREYSRAVSNNKDNKQLSSYALDKYMEMFTDNSRITPIKGRPDSEVRVQVTTPKGNYVWTGSGFRLAYGSENEYPNSIALNRDLGVAYDNGECMLSSSAVISLLVNLLSDFYQVDEASAQFYYLTHPLPDAFAQFSGDVFVTDPMTNYQLKYSQGKWELAQIEGLYPPGVKSSMFGLHFAVEGAGTIYGKDLAVMASALQSSVSQLYNIRQEQRQEIAAKTIYGDYDTLHTCSIPASYMHKPEVKRGSSGSPEAPAVIRPNTVWTSTGWRLCYEKLDVTPISQHVGYLESSCDFETIVPTFLKDFIEINTDLKDEATQAALELEAAMI